MNPPEIALNDKPNIQPEPVIQSNSQLKKQNKSLKLIIGFLTFLVILILCGMGYLYSQLKSVKQTTNSQIVKIPPSTPQTKNQTEVINNVPSDWKTYVNIKYGYTFMYPPYFIKNQESTQGIQLVNNEGYQSNILNPEKYISIGSTVINSVNNKYSFWESEISEKHNYIIDGIDAYKTTFNSREGIDPSLGYEIYFIKSNILYRIEISSLSKDLGYSSTIDALFNQILSTFKFTNELNQYENYKLCTSEYLNVSFQIPNIWICEVSGYSMVAYSKLSRIYIGDNQFSPICGIEGINYPNIDRCKITDFYNSGDLNLKIYNLDGNNAEIYGTANTKFNTKKGKLYFKINTENLSSNNVNADEYLIIDNILKSFQKRD